MKKLAPQVVGVFLVLFFVVGVLLGGLGRPISSVSNVEQVQPGVIVETLDRSLEVYAPYWKTEVARRFNNAVVVLVHGGDFVEGQWVVGTSPYGYGHITPITEVIRHYKAKHPSRVLVILACNTGSIELHGMPGVFFFKNSVWCLPDRALSPEMFENGLAYLKTDGEYESSASEKSRWEQYPDVNGNIFEAVEAK